MLKKVDLDEKFLDTIEELKLSEIRKVISARIDEFKEIGNKPSKEIFKELCFCILCANYSAERCITIQSVIGNGFLTLSEKNLREELKENGYRYPNVRSKYIVEARIFQDSIKYIINSFEDEYELREWLSENIKGIGPKEASHFLRNIGYTNFAILDFHIIDILIRNGLFEKRKPLTKREYLEIEEILKKIALKVNLNLAELDLYLWYMETGKILK
jgi:N-glycosylase/DNA lyase